MANPDFPSPPSQSTPVSESSTSPKPIEGYTDEEAQEIYARAAEIQSESLFRDEKMTPEMLEESANRAGIEDPALYRAIEERKARQKEAEARKAEEKVGAKARAVERAKWQKWAVIAAVIFVALCGATGLVAQSSLGARAAQVNSARAQVDNVLERRHNLIPNLISVTKSTLDNQRSLTEALRAANDATQKASTADEKLAAETRLGSTISQIVTALQSNAGGASPVVLRLSDEMAGAENRIAVERRKYNIAAAEYNRVAGTFPVGFVGRIIGFQGSYKLFEASAESKETPRF